MRPSFSPRRMTVDDATGRVRVDQDVVLLSPKDSLRSMRLEPDGKSSRRVVLEGALQAIITGMIIAVVLTPVMIGFTTMIYGHPEFESVMPMLTKLIFVSSVAHQLAITVLSPMPFAIAQTQDAGLIFLSAMAVSIMTELGPSVPMEERIATVVVHLSISAILVGLGLIALGKLRLASLVQFLPTPVIGGYLAYIGFFMVKGGLTLMTGANLTGIASWGQLFDTHLVALLAPGLICGVLLSVISARFQHFAVFPCCLIAMPVMFFVVLYVSGRSVDDARAYGYLSPETTTFSLVEVYGLFDFGKIHWEVMFPQQLPTLVSMFLVIAFASSLDIASICMGTGTTMDYNEQLQTVGASNLISGLVGGYTGSYIFSQTVFSYRFHPVEADEKYPGFSRLVGLSLAACELAIALTPFSLTTVVPKFLFGSVMIFIGVELLKTWLIGVHSKLLTPEYATVLATFVFLNAFGVQMGLAAGVALAALLFLIEYSRAQSIRIVHKTSNVIRNAEQHQLLYSGSQNRDAIMKEQPIVTVELQGHIFFGSATRIQNRVKKAVFVRLDAKDTNRQRRVAAQDGERLPLLEAANSRVYPKALMNLKGQPCRDRTRGRTRYVIFDFSQVTGLDATAARSCFLALKILFHRYRVTVVYCGMQSNVEFLLRANDVIDSSADEGKCHVTDDLDLALDWCEQQLILFAAKKGSFESGRAIKAFMPSIGMPAPELNVAQVLIAYLSQDKRHKLPGIERILEQEIAPRFKIQRWHQYDQIFSSTDAADVWYVLLRGQVTLYTSTVVANSQDPVIASVSDSMTPRHFRRPQQRAQRTTRQSGTSSEMLADEEEARDLVGRVRAGCIFGDMDFMLGQARSLDAVSSSDDSVTAMITRQGMEQLASMHPTAAYVLQDIVLRAAYMTLAEKLHSIVV